MAFRVSIATIGFLLLLPSFSCFQQPLLLFSTSKAKDPPRIICSATRDVPSGPDNDLTPSSSSSSLPSPQLTLEELASQLANAKFQNIVVVNGAGVSVSAGIPDFRTPGTGLYSRLAELDLPYPEAVFELNYFRQNPKPFLEVAQSIWPGQETGPKATWAHSFVALLDQKKLLKRVYTQNIDGLESLAGVSTDKLIECHGHFRSASCTSISCHRNQKKGTIDIQACRESYLSGKVPECPECNSPVKPDIVFFGENLPNIFVDRIDQDMDECDLLIVMGTSLLVDPVASIPRCVGRNVPRLLINRELVGAFLGGGGIHSKKRDVFLQGDCDDGVRKLCRLVGDNWAKELEQLHQSTSTPKRP